MRVRNILSKLGLGAVILVASKDIFASSNNLVQEVTIEYPASDNKKDKIPEQVQIQNEKLKRLVDLPKENSHEIKDGLLELQKFYKSLGYEDSVGEGGSYAPDATKQNRNKLLNTAKPYYQKLFERCLNELQSDDIQVKEIAANNLDALRKTIPDNWCSSASIMSVVDSKDHLEIIFSSVLKAPIDNEKTLELYLQVGYVLLDFFQNEEYAQRFGNMILTQMNEVLETKESNINNKKKQALLEEAVRKLTSYFSQNISSYTSKVVLSLIPAYTQLIKENNTNPDFLNNALKTIRMLKNQRDYNASNLEVSKKYFKEIFSLTDVTLEGFSKVYEGDEFLKEAFTLIGNFSYEALDIQEKAINLLSKYYFPKASVNVDEFFSFFSKALDNPFLGAPSRLTFNLSCYMLVKTINDNPEYFKANIQEFFRTIKESSNPQEEINAINNFKKLLQYLSFVINTNTIHKTNNDIYPKDLIDKVDNFVYENVEIVFFDHALTKLRNTLENDKDVLGMSVSSKYLEGLLSLRPTFASKNINAILNGLLTEESPKVIKALAYVSSLRIVAPEHMETFLPPYYLVQTIENPNRADFQELCPIEKLVINAIRIISGDINFIKSVVPNKEFPPPVVKSSGEIIYSRENIKYAKELRRLQHNSFLFLTYLTARYGNLPDNAKHSEYKKHIENTRSYYQDIVIKFLEENLQFNVLEFDRDYPEYWGEKLAALIELYGNCHSTLLEREANVQEKLEYLNAFFFKRENSVFNLWANTLLREAVRKNGKSDFELSGPSSMTREEMESKYPQEYKQVRSQMNILRLRMAEGVVRSASHKDLVRLKEHLTLSMPYSELELKDPYGYLETMYNWRPLK